MNPKNLIRKLFIAGATFSSSIALANDVFTSGDWALQIADNRNGGKKCLAYTSTEASRMALNLTLSKDQNGSDPVEIIISGTSQGAPPFALDGEVLQAGLISADPKKVIYWGLAKDLGALVPQLRSLRELQMVDSADPRKKFRFSLSGVSRVLAEFEKRCTSGVAIERSRFSGEFAKNLPAKIQANQLDLTKSTSLRASFKQANSAFLLVLESENELQKLRDRYGSEITRAEAATARKNQIVLRDVPGQQKVILDSTNRLSASRSELKSAEASIPSLTSAIVPLERDFNVKAQRLSEVQPEQSRLSSILSENQHQLRSAQLSLDRAQSELPMVRSDLSNLDFEDRQLERELEMHVREQRDLEIRFRQAQDRLNAFNPQREIELRIRNNPRHSSLKAELESLVSNLSSAEAAEAREAQNAAELESALAACLSNPTEGVSPDCSALQAAVEVAKLQLERLKLETAQIESRVQEKSSRLSSLISEIESEVNRHHRMLSADSDQLSREISDLSRTLSHKNRRIADIRNFEIPQLRDREFALMRAITQADRDIPQLRAMVSSSQNSLLAYESRVGYQAKLQENNRAADALNQARGRLSSAQRQIQNLKSEQVSLASQIASAQASIERLNAETKQIDQELSRLASVLARFNAEKTSLDSKLSERLSAFEAQKREYSRALPLAR